MAPYLLFPSWTAGCFDELRLTRRGEAASAILGALEAVAYQGRGVWRQVMGFSWGVETSPTLASRGQKVKVQLSRFIVGWGSVCGWRYLQGLHLSTRELVSRR